MQVSEDDRWVKTTSTNKINHLLLLVSPSCHSFSLHTTNCVFSLFSYRFSTVGFNVPLDTLLVILEMILLTNHSHSAGTSKTNVTTTKWQHKSNLNNDEWKLLTYAKINLMNLKPGSGFLLHHPERKQAYSTATGPIYNLKKNYMYSMSQ